MPLTSQNKFTLVANTPLLILPADNTRTTAEIQSFLTQPIWYHTSATPTQGPPSWAVPPAIGGIPSVSAFQDTSYPQQDWYAVCSIGGDIVVRWS